VTCRDALKKMPCGSRRAANTILLLAIPVFGILGCGGSPRSDQRVKEQLAEMKASDAPVVKFSGKVTIDGQAPSVPARHVLVVILYSAKDMEPGHETINDAVCDKEGHFEFTRYSKGDGVPPGSYTVLFAELMHRRGSQFTGSDQLKNLYNDPDTSPFHVEITAPGKTDWDFNLEVAGKDPILTPGPHAVTRLSPH
jgi:hypothetical protein